MATEPLPPILTADQVAELLGCQPSRVQQAARDRELPAVRYGIGWVYPTQALIDALNRQAAAHVAPPAPAPEPAPAPAAVATVTTIALARSTQAAEPRRHAPPPLPDPPAELVAMRQAPARESAP